MKIRLFARLALALLLPAAGAADAAHAVDVGTWKGVNISPDVTDQDLKKIHDIGFNLVRLSMNRQPLMNKQAPYDFDESAFARMKAIVDQCRALGIKVVLDPHTTPGTTRDTTTLGSDPLWRDRSYQDLLVKLWGRISKEYATDATVVGYDLLNEPSAPRMGAVRSWNDMAAALVRQIRQNDYKTTIIIESSAERSGLGQRMDRIDSVQSLQLPKDGNIALSIHVYLPKEFTNQGVHGRPAGVTYPGMIAGANWNKAALEAKLKPVQEYAAAHNVSVFIGEFSASRFGDAASTDRYLGDLVGIFGEFGWGWAYHAYNGPFAWSLEEGRAPGGGQVRPAQAAGPAGNVPSRVDLFKGLLRNAGAK